MEWISIKERLPNIDQECLVCSSDNEYSFAILRKVGWIPFCGPSFQSIDFKVTHWIPLPDDPQTQQEIENGLCS